VLLGWEPIVGAPKSRANEKEKERCSVRSIGWGRDSGGLRRASAARFRRFGNKNRTQRCTSGERYSRCLKNSSLRLSQKTISNRPLRGRRGRFGTLLQQLEEGVFERSAVSNRRIQPFSQKSRTPTVAKEFSIDLYDPAEADSELFCNSWSKGVLGERL